MTKSNNEWVPELGAECEGTAESGVSFICRILGVFQGPYPEAKCIVFQYEDGGIEAATESNCYSFSPLKTEAEKRRDELKLYIMDVLTRQGQHSWQEGIADALIDADLIKPKPLTDDEIMHLACARFQNTGAAIADVRDFAKAIEASIRGETL